MFMSKNTFLWQGWVDKLLIIVEPHMFQTLWILECYEKYVYECLYGYVPEMVIMKRFFL